jgi:argininosuccinate lyase
VAFRDAHEVVAHAVKTATAKGVDLAALSLDELKAFDAGIEADVFDVLSLEGSLNARNVLGGTAPTQVRAQVERHRARLA